MVILRMPFKTYHNNAHRYVYKYICIDITNAIYKHFFVLYTGGTRAVPSAPGAHVVHPLDVGSLLPGHVGRGKEEGFQVHQATKTDTW